MRLCGMRSDKGVAHMCCQLLLVCCLLLLLLLLLLRLHRGAAFAAATAGISRIEALRLCLQVVHDAGDLQQDACQVRSSGHMFWAVNMHV